MHLPPAPPQAMPLPYKKLGRYGAYIIVYVPMYDVSHSLLCPSCCGYSLAKVLCLPCIIVYKF